jgi:ABC-type transporter Mla MlaB component
VGIFSLFGKKDGQPAKPAEKSAARAKHSSTSQRVENTQSGNSRTLPPKRDPQAARETALKIDAIESEMSSEFVQVTTTQGGITKPRTVTPTVPINTKTAPPPAQKLQTAAKPPTPSTAEAALVPLAADDGMGTTTGFLLGGETAISDVAAPSSEAAAVIEEVAIMYANGQMEVAEQMLRAAIAEDNLGDVTRAAWLMLFDLYQITGKQQDFESLSLEYVNKFETSPPAWTVNGVRNVPQGAPAGTTPMVTFSGKLDESSAKLVDRIQKLAETYRTLRLEFARVSEVTPTGCHLLLGVLNKLQKSSHDLVLVGAPELAAKVRKSLEVGRRDDTESAWLLLLEILRLLNHEKEFEEISIDYCVTFEVSPPAFVAPRNKITTAAPDAASLAAKPEGFMMPALIEGRIDSLIVAIAAYSDEHDPAIIDCSQLQRVDFNAAGRLLTGLAPFCGVGKVIEFHHVNHLVVELFNVIGLKDIVRILPRKN